LFVCDDVVVGLLGMEVLLSWLRRRWARWLARVVGGEDSVVWLGDDIDKVDRICLSTAADVNICDAPVLYVLVVGAQDAALGGGGGGESESVEGMWQSCDSQKKS
jgi:hypothetical protein